MDIGEEIGRVECQAPMGWVSIVKDMIAQDYICEDFLVYVQYPTDKAGLVASLNYGRTPLRGRYEGKIFKWDLVSLGHKLIPLERVNHSLSALDAYSIQFSDFVCFSIKRLR